MGWKDGTCGCAACRSGAEHPDQAAHAAAVRLMSEFDERQRRLYAATEAKQRGRGGIAAMKAITGLAYETIRRGLDELREAVRPPAGRRVRGHGGGRPRVETRQPGMEGALTELLEAETAGDPQGEGQWTRASLRTLKERLGVQGYKASHETLRHRLRERKYRLRVNAKEKSGPKHADRDVQFRYIKEQATAFMAAGDPVISVDTKKKS